MNLKKNAGSTNQEIKAEPKAKTVKASKSQQGATATLDQKAPSAEKRSNEATNASNKKQTTRIIIKYDVGFPNAFHIRGKGGNLSWDKGILLKNIKTDEWVFETDSPFNSCEFKILINDHFYEIGENHIIECGQTIQYTPKF